MLKYIISALFAGLVFAFCVYSQTSDANSDSQNQNPPPEKKCECPTVVFNPPSAGVAASLTAPLITALGTFLGALLGGFIVWFNLSRQIKAGENQIKINYLNDKSKNLKNLFVEYIAILAAPKGEDQITLRHGDYLNERQILLEKEILLNFPNDAELKEILKRLHQNMSAEQFKDLKDKLETKLSIKYTEADSYHD